MPRISFLLNRDEITDDVAPHTSVLEYLRERRGLTGTKEGCNEGDCGACTIALGELGDDGVKYAAVASCLLPAAKMHGRHVVTIEGLADGDQLHVLQQAILDHHGIQCGYCTPGLTMTLFSLFLANPAPGREEIIDAMDGALCRCTGYASILRAALSVGDNARSGKLSSRGIRPEYFTTVADKLAAWRDNERANGRLGAGESRGCLQPYSLNELFDRLRDIEGNGERTLLSGGTDVMVDVHSKARLFDAVLDLSRIAELHRIESTPTHLVVGGAATLTEILRHPLVGSRFPALAESLRQMCSTQIRNVATLAGNVCTASPIADSIPPLMVYDAMLVLRDRSRVRRIPVREFIIGYRQTAQMPGEIVVAIELPFNDYRASFVKSGKRRALDIATVNSALAVRLDGERIRDVRLAYGGVAAIPFAAERTGEFLKGKCWTESVMREAGEIAAQEITPITDVRGSAEFRRILARNHLILHYLRLAGARESIEAGSW